MVQRIKEDVENYDDKKDNKNLSTSLHEMQAEFTKEVKFQIENIKKSGLDIIIEGVSVMDKTFEKNLPNEILEMGYGEFCKHLAGSNILSFRPNDTLAVIQDLRDRVNSGKASADEIKKYNEVKKLL